MDIFVVCYRENEHAHLINVVALDGHTFELNPPGPDLRNVG